MKCNKNSVCDLYSKISYTCNWAWSGERDYCGIYRRLIAEEEKDKPRQKKSFLEKLISSLEEVCDRKCGCED